MDLLQVLFDNGWKSGGLEFIGLWLVLVMLQVDNGCGDSILVMLVCIDSLVEIICLCSDKCFDCYVDCGDVCFDLVQVVQCYFDELCVFGLFDCVLDVCMVEFSIILLMLDCNEEVLLLIEGMVGVVSNGELFVVVEVEWVVWLFNSWFIVLCWLGCIDEVLVMVKQVVCIGVFGLDGVEYQMNVGFVFSLLGCMQDVVQVVNDMLGFVGYGKVVQVLLQFVVVGECGDVKVCDVVCVVILVQCDDVCLFYCEMLLEEGDLDGVVVVLIEQLCLLVECGEILVSLQDMCIYLLLLGDVCIDVVWCVFKQCVDVQVEVVCVGCIECYDLVSSFILC